MQERAGPFFWRCVGVALVAAFASAQVEAVLAQTPSSSPSLSTSCTRQAFEGASFEVCAFDAKRQELRLVDVDQAGAPLRSLTALKAVLGEEAGRVRFAMNAGMFDQHGRPIGLYVEKGQRLHALNTASGAGNFYMKPNGVFSLDASGRARIEATNAFHARGGKTVWASQSGPMLVIGGALNPQIQDDGPSVHIRNGVGLTRDGKVNFVISDDPVSFGKLARLFRDPLGCADALYFDGSVSSLWDAGAGRMDVSAPLGPMLVVLDRSAH